MSKREMNDHPKEIAWPARQHEVFGILERGQSMFRRPMKVQPPEDIGEIIVGAFHPTKIDRHGEEYPGAEIYGAYSACGEWGWKSPYGKPGDVLWVKEGWRCTGGGDIRNIIYRADGDTAMSFCGVDDGRIEILKVPEAHWPEWDRLVYETRRGCEWRPSIHMPKWACRLRRTVKNVRVERVQDISEADAKAEGVSISNALAILAKYYRAEKHSYSTAFMSLWNSLYGPGAWERNGYVWVTEFEGHEGGVTLCGI